MAILSSLARRAARATGRALSVHVLPDSLIPSWKTRKAVSSGYLLLKKATRKAGKPKKNAPASARPKSAALAGVARPSSRPPKQKFDRNAWGQGRALRPAAGYDAPPRSRSTSSSASSKIKPASRLAQQINDLRRHPRLVLEMGLDSLRADYEGKKRRFLSNFKTR